MDGLPVGAMDETFFAAQRRHRRTARLYSALAAFAAVLQGIPLAIILSPVFVGIAVLVADLVNLWYPVPDVVPAIGRAIEGVGGESTVGETEPTVPLLLLVAVPGLLAMLVLWWLVRRFLLRDGLGGVLITAGARPADRTDDEEHQLVNVVEEISLAAGIRPPRVLVLPADVPDAAAFGRSPESWTIAVSRGLLDNLDRDATQGVIAHLAGSVGNGDLRIQHSLLALFVSQQLAQDVITAPFARSARGRVRGPGG
jgi:Zn-dependent protease with chaperone function